MILSFTIFFVSFCITIFHHTTLTTAKGYYCTGCVQRLEQGMLTFILKTWIVSSRVLCVFLVGASGKNSPTDTGDVRDEGLIPGSGRSPGGGDGNPL